MFPNSRAFPDVQAIVRLGIFKASSWIRPAQTSCVPCSYSPIAMTKTLYNTIKGLTDSSIKTESGILLVLPTAVGAVLNPGIKDQEVMAMSRLGEMVIVDTYPTERKPEIKLEWTQKNIQLLSMRLGLEFGLDTSADSSVVNTGLNVTKGSYPGSLTGYEGFGMTADQVGSVAYYLTDDQTTVALTRQPFATFTPATPLSFAQGAAGATKWSDDLIGKYVAYEFPHVLSNILTLSDVPQTNFSMRLMTIMSDRTLLEWEFRSVSVKKDQGDINLTEPKMELTFYVQDDGSSCLPYTIRYKGKAQKRTCGL